jgi:hypothetical protein
MTNCNAIFQIAALKTVPREMESRTTGVTRFSQSRKRTSDNAVHCLTLPTKQYEMSDDEKGRQISFEVKERLTMLFIV